MDQEIQGRGFRPLVLFLLCAFALAPFFSFGVALSQGLSTSDTYREAYDAGYADGSQAGRQDSERGRLFDLANKKSFQTADRTLDPDRHERDVYIVAYRRGFEDGYEEGYGLARNPAYRVPPAPSASSATADRPDLTPSPGEKVKVPEGTQIKVVLFDMLSTRYNERGDTFRAEVMKEVEIDGNTVIPKKTKVLGTVGHLKRAGRVTGRAEMNLQFDGLEFADGSKFPIQATVVSIERQGKKGKEKVKGREGVIRGRGSKSRDTKRIGKVSGVGALIGILAGRRKGAAIGAAAGAVIGLASVLTSRGRDVHLPPRTALTIELNRETSLPASLQRPHPASVPSQDTKD